MMVMPGFPGFAWPMATHPNIMAPEEGKDKDEKGDDSKKEEEGEKKEGKNKDVETSEV